MISIHQSLNNRVLWIVGLLALAFLAIWYNLRSDIMHRSSADSSVSVSSNGTTISNTASATFTSEGSSTEEKVTSNTASATSSKKIAATKTTVDATKSHIRLDGENILADGVATYRIVIELIGTTDTQIIDQQPQIVITGGDATASGALLVGGEWFITVSSTEPGEKTAVISAGGQEIGKIPMTFVSSQSPVLPVVTAEPAASPVVPLTFWQKIGAFFSEFFINTKDGFIYMWHSLFGKTNN